MSNASSGNLGPVASYLLRYRGGVHSEDSRHVLEPEPFRKHAAMVFFCHRSKCVQCVIVFVSSFSVAGNEGIIYYGTYFRLRLIN